MSKISEFFGLNCNDDSQDIKKVLDSQICPYTKKICTKMRKSNPNIKIGTCSVKYQNQDLIICPSRFLENNRVFNDCISLLAKHSPNNELYLITEVQIPGGYVDYFLVSTNNKKVVDFVGIEIQAIDTIRSVWPERQRFLKEKGLRIDDAPNINKKTFGMNWKMTLKTTLIQMHHKAKFFESMNKHLVLIIQKPLFEHMQHDFDSSEIKESKHEDTFHIHVYELKESNLKFNLSFDTNVSTDSKGIEKCLGLNTNKEINMDDLFKILEPKVTETNRIICPRRDSNSYVLADKGF